MARGKRILTLRRTSLAVVPVSAIERQIHTIRDHKVMLDKDLAAVYGVAVKQLNQAVRRNLVRFPPDFMFQLTEKEFEALRSQIVTSKGRGGRRYRPFASTEHGAVMLASVLNSPIAVDASILVVRAFVRLRGLLNSNREFRVKLREIESKLHDHDEQFAAVFEAIRELMEEDEEESIKPPIGYHTEAQGRASQAKRIENRRGARRLSP